MKEKLRHIWHRHRLLSIAFGLSLALAVAFGAMATLQALRWRDLPQNPPIAGWMTPAYVARSWHIPREVMIDLLDETPLVAGRGARITLAELAVERGVPLAELISQIEAGIADFQASP